MTLRAALLLSLAVTGCVTDAADDEFAFDQSKPSQTGKADGPTACGTETCEAALCGYDCSVAGEQATKGCATTDTRPTAFVAGSAGGASFDSRTNPYAPVFSLDKVLVYGCELWDYSDGSHDGLAIQYEELIHSSFTVNPSDPTRTGKNFEAYISNFVGPGSYKAQARYSASSDATTYAAKDACAIDVAVDASGTVTGTFSCTIGSQTAGSTSVNGTFGCGKNAMSPIFSRWAAAPQ